MPIGKNSIKRVTNNGYSNVKSEAPDMQNSEVIEQKAKASKAKERFVGTAEGTLIIGKMSSEELAKLTEKSEEKAADMAMPEAKKPSLTQKAKAKNANCKSKGEGKGAPKSKAPKEQKAAKEPAESNTSYINIGREMPTYLL